MDKNYIEIKNLFPKNWKDYTLIDSGDGRKLEKFGTYIFNRPETQAMWAKRLNPSNWEQADGIFFSSDLNSAESGKWKLKNNLPKHWVMKYNKINFLSLPTPFRHLGFFPEQSSHWDWTDAQIKKFITKYKRPPNLLNLFAYSGLASLNAALSGASVTHVDASKKAIDLAFKNRELSKLNNFPIRFIIDDAISFVEKEFRRGRVYDGFILDPPKYGRGPKGQKWEINECLPILLKKCKSISSKTPFLFILTVYAIRISLNSILYTVIDNLKLSSGKIEFGELGITEQGTNGRAIGQAIYARWSF